MKAKQRKLIPAIAMLLVSAVTLTSASYAWFTMSREVTADGIQLTAVAPTNLLISSEKTWGSAKDSITDTLKDFAATTTVTLNNGAADAAKISVGKLMPASSHDGIKFFYPLSIDDASAGAPTDTTKFKAVDVTKEMATIENNKAVDGYFIDIPLWLKNEGNKPVNVTVNATKTEITAEGENKNIYKAARFAILDSNGAKFNNPDMDGWMIRSSDPAFFTGITGTIASDSGVDSWKGVADVETDFASGKKTLFTIDAGKTDPTKIIVRVWLEGQDASCVHANKEQSFNIKLVLSDLDYLNENTPVAP